MSEPSTQTTGWLVILAAKGLQQFVLGSDRLREMVGATELIDQLPRNMLPKVIKQAGVKTDNYRIISAAAGIARVRFTDIEEAEALLRVWPVFCSHFAPGLEMHCGLASLNNGYLAAVREAEEQIRISRNVPFASLPEIAPPVLRNPRSGLAAVGRDEKDLIDLPGQAKRRMRREARNPDEAPSLPALFKTVGFEIDAQIPRMFDDISGNDRAYLAVVHADGNGLGQMFIDLETHLAVRDGYRVEEFYSELSQAIIEAGNNAAKNAMQSVAGSFDKSGPWPALPIVLAGDDLTFVLRADLAIDFTRKFLKEFVKETGTQFKALKGKPEYQAMAKLPDYLSAGAGIVFVKPSYPFSSAYALCESLAGFAKKKAKGKANGAIPPSTVAFHRVTASSTEEEFDKMRETELRGAPFRNKHLIISLAPYQVDGGPAHFPSLDDLEKLVDIIEDLPRGQVRELLAHLYCDTQRAAKHFERFVNLQDAQARKQGTEFKNRLNALTGNRAPELYTSDGECPLGDAITWAALRRTSAKAPINIPP